MRVCVCTLAPFLALPKVESISHLFPPLASSDVIGPARFFSGPIYRRAFHKAAYN